MRISNSDEKEIAETEMNISSTSKRLFKNEKKRQNLILITRSLLSVVIVIATLGLTNKYYNESAQKYVTEQVLETMTKVSSQLSTAFSDKVETWFNELNTLEQLVSFYDGTDESSTLETMNTYLTSIRFDSFDEVGVFTRDKKLMLSNGQTFDVQDDAQITRFYSEDIGRFSCVPSLEELNNQLIFSIPYSNENSKSNLPIMGIVGVADKKNLTTILTTDIFGKNNAYVVISDAQGNVILDTESQRRFGSNLIDTFRSFADESIVNQLSNDLQSGNRNTYELMGVTQRFSLFCSSITPTVNLENDLISNWRLLVLTSTGALNKNIAGLFWDSKVLIYSIVITMFVILALMGFLFERKNRKNLVLESTDSLTGLLNNRRFHEDANLLIRNSKEKYAVVSINIL